MTRSERSAFGMLLRRHRVDAGLTQEELAERALLSARGISDLERGVNRSPRYDSVRHLATALQLSPIDRASFEALAHNGGARADTRDSPTVTWPTGNYLGAVPDGRLIGREQERERVLTTTDAIRRGEGRMLVLVGEPGIGKTRLAQDVALELLNRGFVVATGRSYESEQTVPFYPFLETLGVAYQTAPRSVREAIPHRWAYLGRLIPDQCMEAPPPTADAHDEQQRLFRAVAGFLAAIAEIQPIAVMFDDLHWADDASLKLLLHLARHTRGNRILLLGTYRDVEVRRQHPLEQAMLDLQREGLVQRVHLPRLNQEETAAFIADRFEGLDVSSQIATIVYQRTEGNVFFLGQVLQSLVERGDIYRVGDRWTWRGVGEMVVPESVSAVVEQRLAHLSFQSQEVLRDASVLGPTFLFDDLDSVSQQSEEELEQSLQEARAAGLVRYEGKDRYAFDHTLTLQTLYEAIPPRRRRKLHGAAGQALEGLLEVKRRERAPDIARHFLESDYPDRALPYVMLAGEQAAAIFAYTEAEGYYRTALDLATQCGDEDAQGRALEQLGRLLRSAGRFDEALVMSERAAQLYETQGDLEAAGRVVALVGQLHVQRGTFAEGKQRVQAMLAARAGADPSPSLAALYAALDQLGYFSGRLTDSLAAAEQAADLARALGDDRVLARIELSRSWTLLTLGRAAEAHRLLEEQRVIADRLGDPYSLMDALLERAAFAWATGPLEESKTLGRQGLDLAERVGDPERIVRMSQLLGAVYLDAGEWDQAERHARRAMSLFATRRSVAEGAWALGILAELLVLQGRWDEAADWLDDCQTFLDSARYLPGEPAPRSALALADLLRGRPQSALERFMGAQGAQRQVSLAEASICTTWPHLVWAQLEVGQIDQAEATALKAIQQSVAQGCIRGQADALCVQGMVRDRQGRCQEAMETFEQAVTVARRLPYPFGEARALYAWGRMDGRQPAIARERLTEALVIFQRLGANPFVALTQEALSRLA